MWLHIMQLFFFFFWAKVGYYSTQQRDVPSPFTPILLAEEKCKHFWISIVLMVLIYFTVTKLWLTLLIRDYSIMYAFIFFAAFWIVLAIVLFNLFAIWVVYRIHNTTGVGQWEILGAKSFTTGPGKRFRFIWIKLYIRRGVETLARMIWMSSVQEDALPGKCYCG